MMASGVVGELDEAPLAGRTMACRGPAACHGSFFRARKAAGREA